MFAPKPYLEPCCFNIYMTRTSLQREIFAMTRLLRTSWKFLTCELKFVYSVRNILMQHHSLTWISWQIILWIRIHHDCFFFSHVYNSNQMCKFMIMTTVAEKHINHIKHEAWQSLQVVPTCMRFFRLTTNSGLELWSGFRASSVL